MWGLSTLNFSWNFITQREVWEHVRLAEVLDSCMCAERGKGKGKTEMTFLHVPTKWTCTLFASKWNRSLQKYAWKQAANTCKFSSRKIRNCLRSQHHIREKRGNRARTGQYTLPRHLGGGFRPCLTTNLLHCRMWPYLTLLYLEFNFLIRAQRCHAFWVGMA